MRIFTLLLIAFLALPTFSFAKEVSVEDAKRVAKNFYYRNAKNPSVRNYEALNLTVNNIELDGNTYFYTFDIEGRDGFVITSAHDFTNPILGFSDRNNVDFNNLSPELRYMLDGYKKQIKYGIENNARPSSKANQAWQNLQIPSTNRTSVVDTEGPLLLTTWNQSPYYNDMCPGSGGNLAPSGCVAVAMSQIMKYYNYPAQGTGSKSYYDSGSQVTNYDNINFGQQTYAWDNMPISLSGPNDEVAKLMYHCGHSVEMDWELAGSGTQSSYVVTALKTYFGYASGANEYSKENWMGNPIYSDATWGQMIRDEIDLLRPIIYSGFSEGASVGHAWNCDGYMDDGNGGYFYHMNYGWGGYGDGYFALDNLISETIPGGDDELFDTGHQIILSMYPQSGYPQNCSGTRTVNGFEGLIGDGSGYAQYQNNLDCETIILPECARGKVMLNFENFDLAAGDMLYIYNGTTVDDPVLAILDQNNPPEMTQYTSIGGMLIRFVTNSSGTAQGWDAKYTSYTCGSITSTEGEATMTDGSGTCDYETGLYCHFYIEPTGATQITLNFSEFDLDSPDNDYVSIFDNVAGGAALYTFKQSTPPTGDIVMNTSEVKVRFRTYSNETNVGEGWTLTYTSDVVGIDDLVDFEELVKVYPNPFKSDAFVEISNPNAQEVKIVLTDIIGRTIATKDFNDITNTRTINLTEMGSVNFEKGIYLLNVQIGNQTKTYKLISE